MLNHGGLARRFAVSVAKAAENGRFGLDAVTSLAQM
jgi:hypothetical protein